MNETRDLICSRDFAKEDARNEKISFGLSAIITAGTLAMSGLGIEIVMSGENTLAGTIMFGVSAALTAGMGHLAIDEFRTYHQLEAEATIIEAQLDQHLSEK